MSGMRVLTLEDMKEFYEQCEREEQVQADPQPGTDAAGDDQEA